MAQAGGTGPTTPIDAYLEIYDRVAQEGELLQVRYVDRRLSLPPEWLGEFILNFLTSAVAGVIANAAYSGQGRLDDALDRVKRRKRMREAAVSKTGDSDRDDAVELLQPLPEVPAEVLSPLIERAVNDALLDAGVEPELGQPVAESIRRIIEQFAEAQKRSGQCE